MSCFQELAIVAIACLCLLGWLNTDPGILNTSLHSALIAATFVTLLFNANPLMRFDGYYILLDALGIPNLGTKGQQFLVWVGKRVFLGMEDLPMPIAARQHPVAVPVYGVLAAIWKILIWIGIMIFVSLLFKGAGLFPALASVAVIVVTAVVKFSKFLFKSGSGPKLSRALPRLGVTVLLLLGVFWFARFNPTGKALAVVEYAEREMIRAGVRGKVTEVLVEQDDSVKKGDLLLTLSNPDEESERDKLVLELRTARIRARSYYQQENLPAHQAELETIIGLERKLEESLQYLAALKVVAPKDGVISGRQLKTLEGQWLNTGDEILSVIAGDERELLVSFRQEDVESVISQKTPAIKVRLRGRSKTIDAVIERIESRATRALPHEVMAASSGGPLALRASSDPVAERERGIARGGGEYDSDLDYFNGLGDRQPARELARARFAGRYIITDSRGQSLREGEWGCLRFANAEKERLGKWLYNEVSTYVKEKIQQARAAAS